MQPRCPSLAMWGAAAVMVVVAMVVALLPGPSQAQSPSVAYVLGGGAAMPPWATDDVVGATGDDDPTRLAGANRFTTSVAVSRHLYPSAGPDTVYVADGWDFPDALAAATAVAANDAGLVLTEGDGLPDAVAAELQRLAPEHVVVLGGPAAVGDRVLDDIEGRTGVRPDRVAGGDRFATAAAIARHAFPSGGSDTVFLASGATFADALAAAPAVAADEAALLLVHPDGLPDSAARELRRLAPDEVVVLGGAAAVADDVLDEVEAATGIRPRRLAGVDRFATAAAIAETVHPDGAGTVYATSGLGFADALAAVPAVVADDAGLLLVDTRLRWLPDPTDARAYAAARAGGVSFSVVGPDGRHVGYASQTRVPMASVLKVMFMTAYLQQPDVRDRALTGADRALLEPMITRSANAPATTIANRLGPAPLYDLAAAAGMRSFSYTRPWGLSTTSARDQSRFMMDLDRHLPDRHRSSALSLLADIVDSQRWGIGQVATPGWTKRFKGGWGSGTGATDHQVVRLEHPSGARVALAVMTTNSPSHAYGKETLRGVFSRLLADLP